MKKLFVLLFAMAFVGFVSAHGLNDDPPTKKEKTEKVTKKSETKKPA